MIIGDVILCDSALGEQSHFCTFLRSCYYYLPDIQTVRCIKGKAGVFGSLDVIWIDIKNGSLALGRHEGDHGRG